MFTMCHSLGNASYEPSSPYDAYSRPAGLHASSRHDASPRNGAWPDPPRCNGSDDAWPNASAGNDFCPPVLYMFNQRWTFQVLFLFCQTFAFSYRLQKIHRITSSSSPTCQRRRTSWCSPCSLTSQYWLDNCFMLWLSFLPNISKTDRDRFLRLGSLALKRCVWSLVAMTSPLWSLIMRFRLELHEIHYRDSKSHRLMQWRSHLPRNNANTGWNL